MKTFFAAVCLIAFCAASCQTTQAIRSNELIEAVLDQQNQHGLLESFTSLLGVHDKPLSEKKAYTLIKYIVVPTKAKGFIAEVEEAKKAAEKFDGYITYNLVKTVDDNISYYGWAAWDSVEELVEYIKSDSAKKLIEYVSKEDIVTLITGVKPIV